MFANKIIAWYEEHQRTFPWRNISDPYRIWVSEIILQQTRTVQGHDYYLRFLEAFPNVQTLASASEDEVLRVWQGLGYYSRARNMHAAARQIVATGHFPTTYEGVLALKGVGEYTAAAVCSFAYHLPCAVVDGNVYRVLSRYFGLDTPIDTPQGHRAFAELAATLLPKDGALAAEYNQGLMDFGALQCVPKSPVCADCPLSSSCSALQSGSVDTLPIKQHRVKSRQRYLVFVKVVSAGKVWIERRAKKDIWKGLYQFHLQEYDHSPSLSEVQSDDFFAPYRSKGTWRALRLKVKHVLTHQLLWTDFYELKLDEYAVPPSGYIAVAEADIEDYAFPQLYYKAGILTRSEQ